MIKENKKPVSHATPKKHDADCIFSVDVEDWFHLLDLPGMPEMAGWTGLPSHVGNNFHKLLDLFDSRDVKVTCFFLGWVAQRYPELVREAVRRGHEVGSHGYSHALVYQMTHEDFLRDVAKAKDIIEQSSGNAVAGYRAPGFSVTTEVPWFFDALVEAGYRYDSSVFPAKRQHGGLRAAIRVPHRIDTPLGSITEFPISVTDLFGRPVCFFGGGYLRLFPMAVIRYMSHKVLSEGGPVIYYVHPREIDPDHPRLPMSIARRFKSYVGLRTTEGKITQILDAFHPIPFNQYLLKHPV